MNPPPPQRADGARHGPASARILALGDWPAARLHSGWTESTQRLTATQQQAVDEAWAQALAVPGVHLFDGGQCRLESFVADENGLHLQLSRTSYKLYIGTNARHPEWADAHGANVLANPVGTSVALRSADGQLVFGRRGQAVALYPGCAHPFGGTLEPPAPGGQVDLIAEMQRELTEEIGLAPSDLDDLRAIALTEDRVLRQPELVYAARCRLPCAAITARLDLHEHTACWTLPDEAGAIDETLRGATPITPVLRATLLAWGATRFGSAWLHRHGQRIGG